jgi:hypothetical protein
MKTAKGVPPLRVHEPPRVGDKAARALELMNRHRAAVVLAVDDRAPPVEEHRVARQRAAQDDMRELLAAFGVDLGAQRAHLGEAELLAPDQDTEVARPQQRRGGLALGHGQRLLQPDARNVALARLVA